MRHVPSTVWFGVVCGTVFMGCSNATPPKPQPEPPRVVAAAPVAATPAESAPKPAATNTPGDDLASLQQSLAAAPDKNARVLVIDDIAKLGQKAKVALADLIKWTADEDPRTRWHAARAIGLIGEDALSAMPTLLKLLTDDDPIVATQAAAAVGLIREDDGRKNIPEPDASLYASAVDPLVKSATHPDPRVRRSAVRALTRLKPEPGHLAPLVTKQLADADPSVVMPALHTLSDMDGEAVPFLVEAIKDPKARYWVIIALTEIGPESAPAVESLTQLAAESETHERLQAFLALAAIGEKAASASPVMVKSLESDDETLRSPAAYALGRVRAQDADAALKKAADDKDPFLAEVASWALARIHPDDKALVDEAVKRLRAGLHCDRSNERTATASALSDLAEKLDEPTRLTLANEFADLLSDPDPDVGLSGGAALVRLGATAVETLLGKLSDPALRAKALEILSAIGPAAKPAVDDMLKLLADVDPGIREEAAIAIGAIGPDAAAAVPALQKILADDTAAPGMRYAAAYALGRIGPAAKPAIDQLRALATATDEVLATVAIWATLKVDPQDQSLHEQAVSVLRKALRAEREIVRLEAAVTLGDIGAAAAPAIPILELISEEDGSRQVRAAAANALKKLKGE